MGVLEQVVSDSESTSSSDQDLMTLAQSARRSSSSATPETNKVVSVRIETSTREQASLNPDKVKSCAEKAEKFKANLEPEFPSFVKAMLRSHVSGGYWLGLPEEFCSLHLPKHDVVMTIIDENQEEYETKFKFHPGKSALSGGWKAFSVSHKLVMGDHLVFQLVKDITFQVYIIRTYRVGAADFTAGSHQKYTSRYTSAGKRTKTCGKTEREQGKTVTSSIHQPSTVEKSGSESKKVYSEVPVLEGIRPLKNKFEFKDVKNLESFTIVVNGVIIDSEFSKDARRKYYELCCSQNAFLHDNLLESISMKLAAGAITEIVDVADAIKASKLSNFRDDFAAWIRSLEVLEQLGMSVGFLRARLQLLLKATFESEEVADLKHYNEAMVERARVKAKISELEAASKRLDTEIEPLEKKARMHELKFQEEANSPW